MVIVLEELILGCVISLCAMLFSFAGKDGVRPVFALQVAISNVALATAVLGGTGMMLLAGSAKADSCRFGGYIGPQPLCAVGLNLFAGDKKATLTSLPSLGRGTIDLTFLPVGNLYSVQVGFDTQGPDPTFLAAPFGSEASPETFAYDLEVVSGNSYFTEVQLTVDAPGSTPTAGTFIVKSETTSPDALFSPLKSEFSASPVPPFPVLFQSILGAPAKVKIRDSYWSTGGGLSSFTNTFRQATNDVPGPLPLMGAGMAFGFSRKLRSRIKSSARAKA